MDREILPNSAFTLLGRFLQLPGSQVPAVASAVPEVAAGLVLGVGPVLIQSYYAHPAILHTGTADALTAREPQYTREA